MRRSVRIAVVLVGLTACFEPSRPERVGALIITPGSLALASGAQATLGARVESTEGRTLIRPVSWESSNPDMLTVSPAGVIVAGFNTNGTPLAVQITATAVGAIGVASVSVLPSPVASFALPAGPFDLAHGDTLTLVPAMTDAEGRSLSGYPVSFVSRDPAAIGVSATGALITPGFVGASRSAYVVASIGAFQDSVFVTVGSTTVASLSITPGALYLAPGRSRRLVARALSPAGIPMELTKPVWSSPNPAVASVDDEGIVTGASLGDVTLEAEYDGVTGSVLVTVNTCGAGPAGAYPIELRYISADPGGSIGSAFECALERLRAMLVDAPVAPVTYTNFNASPCAAGVTLNEVVNGLLIFATVEAIDGPGTILGSAGPCYLRSEDGLPSVGRMRFDIEDLADIDAAGLLDEVILHEMLHVLGFGTAWTSRGVFAVSGSGPRFVGTRARAACVNDHGGASVCSSGVPIEDCVGIPGCGAGTINSHWKELTFGSELMTGFVNTGFNPFSRMTIQSMADIGYGVDAAQADDFFLTPSLVLEGSVPAGVRLPEPTLPTHVVDRFGNPTRIQY